MNWLNPSEITKPVITAYATTADFMLAYGVWTALQNPDLNFLAANPDAQYANPQAYIAAMVTFAESLLQNTFPISYAPIGWDPIAAAKSACATGFNLLSQIPVSVGDDNSLSVFVAWILGTGQLPGGHPVVVTPISSGTNVETGPSSIQGGTILGGTGAVK